MKPKTFWDWSAWVLAVLELLAAGAFGVTWCVSAGEAMAVGFACGILLLLGMVLLQAGKGRSMGLFPRRLLLAATVCCGLAVLFLAAVMILVLLAAFRGGV